MHKCLMNNTVKCELCEHADRKGDKKERGGGWVGGGVPGRMLSAGGCAPPWRRCRAPTGPGQPRWLPLRQAHHDSMREKAGAAPKNGVAFPSASALPSINALHQAQRMATARCTKICWSRGKTGCAPGYIPQQSKASSPLTSLWTIQPSAAQFSPPLFILLVLDMASTKTPLQRQLMSLRAQIMQRHGPRRAWEPLVLC